MKRFNTLLVTFVVTTMMLISTADAKSFGGRSSSSSSFSSSSRSSGSSFSSSSRSSGGSSSGSSRSISIGSGKSSSSSSTSSSAGSKWFGNTTTNQKRALFGGGTAAVGGAAIASSNQQQASKPAPIKVTRDNVMTSLNGGKGAKGDAAGVLFKDFQKRNTPPIQPSGKLNTADIDRAFSTDYRTNRRKEFYGQYQPTQNTHYRETVHVQHSGGYGMWDYLMFDSIMDNVGDRQMYYHHQNDQAFKDWRADANAACAAGDKDVCEKLADLDKEMNEYKSKGVQVNPNYITPGVDPDVYESNNIDRSKLPEMKVCTGAVGSDYSQHSAILGRVTKLKVNSISSNGSVDNIAKMATGACDLGWAQDDLAQTPNLTKLLTVSKPEAAMLICPKDAKIKTTKDLSDKITIYVGSDQTGSAFTLNQIKDKVPGLSKAVINDTQATMVASNLVKDSKDKCLFTVTSPEHPAIMELDKSGKAQMVEISPVQGYKTVNVDMSHYKNLTNPDFTHRTGFMWLSKEGGTDSIGVTTSLLAPQTWIDQNKQLFDLLLLERVNLQSSIR